MATTRIFKSGNSQAVRIPREFQFDDMDMELEIERRGESLILRPAKGGLDGVLEKFKAFDDGFMESGRQQEDEPDRDVL
ncbi:MAG: antitoxin [Endozoicomonas sp.]